VVIESGGNAAAEYLRRHFNLNAVDSHIVTQQFLDNLSTSRTKTELAELISHQGHQEIAHGAYFCVHLKLGEYYDQDYLEWRSRSMQNKRLGQFFLVLADFSVGETVEILHRDVPADVR